MPDRRTSRAHRREVFQLLLLLALCARPAAAQLVEVAGDFPLWRASTATWESWAFEDFYAFYPQTTGCVSATGPIILQLTGGTLTLAVSEGSCPIYDGTSADDVAEGSIPQGETLTLGFDPPIRGFYASFGSVATGHAISLRALGNGGFDEIATSPASTDNVLGQGYGFLSMTPIHTLEISSSEPGAALLGHFLGVVPEDEAITGPPGSVCSNAPCDVAIVTELRHPITFVTPTAGTADLGSWPEAMAVAASGLAAGDAICQYWANEAGLSHPGQFVAFLGSGTTGPFCRVLGLTGTWHLCDGASLPEHLARWSRVDGLPWGAPLDFGGLSVFRPSLDALGERVDSPYFTGWTPAHDCAGWTATTGSTQGGEPDSVVGGWASDGNLSLGCGSERPLLCFERAVGMPYAAEQSARRVVFVTRAKGPGDLRSWPEADVEATTGLDAADSICRSEAADAGLDEPDTFRAWLSTTTADAVDRLTEPGPYARSDGLPVAASVADLIDGLIETGIARFADGGDAKNLQVWTGTTADGTFEGGSCGDWESTAGMGHRGRSALADSAWTSFSDSVCDLDAHLYCVSDAAGPPPLFADGFESGDVGEWSVAVP